MAKQFLRIAKTNASKNKVQSLVIMSLEMIDNTLHKNIGDAKKMVKHQFDQALKQYTGKAKIPELKEFNPSEETTSFYVEDLIYIDIHSVKIDFSH